MAPQQAWVCDITYLCIGLSFGYLSLLTDAYLKLIVGYCLHPLLTVEDSLKALEVALQREPPSAAPLIHHSGVSTAALRISSGFGKRGLPSA
ncbi:hypothetical protein [Hymenobacter bucti]|uniref:Integrase catalytic domain-containing protein n=1 Tax=Hymenobacter bucti TaxID=1844114 RepID=A0ABW4R1F8_9BACT